jgi:Ca-activated chloride channel family protein
MASRLTAVSWCLLCFATLGSGARAADDPPTLMILLDGSGSMWGQMPADGRAKLEIARDVLRQSLPRIKPEARLGFASFGHRRRGNCADAEVIVPPQPNNIAALTAPLDRLSALGKGPLALALRDTAAAIGEAKPASIVMLFDDLDNCGQDACAVAADIAAKRPGLTVHGIGLGLDKPRLQQIACVAQMTGGKLYDAQDGAGVAAAFNAILQLANLEPQGPDSADKASASQEAAAGQPPSNAPPGLYLTAGLGPESATLESPVRWRVIRGGTDGEVVREVRAANLYEKLAPGTYEVEARLGLAFARQTVEVVADAPTAVRVNLDAGVLKLLARAIKGGQPLQTPIFTVTAQKNPGLPLWMGRETQPEIVLPAGEYVVSAENGIARQDQTVKIAAATGTTFDAVLATGRLELSAVRGSAADQGEAVAEGVTFTVYEDDPDAPQGRREVARSAAPAPVFTLPAGTYYVTARAQGAEAREQIGIGAGGIVKRAMPLALSRLLLTALLDGAPPPPDMALVFTVTRLDGEPHQNVRTTGKQPQLELSAGRYRIEAALGSTNIRGATELTLTAGQDQKVVFKLVAGHVTLRLAEAEAGAGNDVFWEIEDEQRHTVMRTSQAQPSALLAPGRYLVTSETREKPLRGVIEVKAGEQRTFEIGG